MKYLFSFLFVLAVLGWLWAQQRTAAGGTYWTVYAEAEKNYKEAEQGSFTKNYSEEKEEALNRTALRLFLQVIPFFESGRLDSLSVITHTRIGSIYHYLDSLEAAKEHYLKAIRWGRQNTSLPDSFLFKPCLYAGTVYYSLHQYDSAVSFYKQAETISEKYTSPLTDQQRLYNQLGLIHYETGNYKQARNYFDKALSKLSPADPALKELRVTYQNNIASALLNLEQYEEAKAIYLQLLPSPVYKNVIRQNLGMIDLSLGAPADAIRWFRQTTPAPDNTVQLYNKMAKAFLEMKLPDSAAFYLALADTENKKRNGNTKNVTFGLTLTHQAELALSKHQPAKAVALYQQAVIQFHHMFNDTAFSSNPEKFTGVYSYIQLFNALCDKADALQTLYQQSKEITPLAQALDAYQAAFRLASYVEHTYDSDEARLFLGKIKHHIHSKPIDISLQLYELTGKINYLEQTYNFDQLNKASILTLNVQENELRTNNNQEKGLITKETNIKKSITRLILEAGREKDSTRLGELRSAVRDQEIELGKIQDKIAADPQWSIREAGASIPPVTKLQRKLDNNSALLSYHLSDRELLALLITNKKFEYYKTDIDPVFFKRLEQFKNSLQQVSPDERYEGGNNAYALYQVLIKPLYASLKQSSRLIIIPDDELNHLPFEALQDENRKYLLEHFSIQYQFSTALFGENPASARLSNSLAFAPFTQPYPASVNQEEFYSLLPASAEEISGLKGKILSSTNATKKNFLAFSNSYPILHLATHASVNNDTPSHSYIAFYPDNRDYKLYAGEIANLRLDSVQLVILSACETGAGKLVKGEGLMSLSRAFAYAGCPDIITSLWKAEDKTTAFITKRLHYYLEKGYSKDKALQQGKIDLLKSNEIDPRLKTPDYWAHLIYIGNYEEDRGSRNWWWIALTIIGGAFLYKMVGRKNN
ncbi:MAG: CHAT domain-containing protein [Chitinophagales bacterium]|nr:CHAT domain-containing protein [Chitinophagales bacterium]